MAAADGRAGPFETFAEQAVARLVRLAWDQRVGIAGGDSDNVERPMGKSVDAARAFGVAENAGLRPCAAGAGRRRRARWRTLGEMQDAQFPSVLGIDEEGEPAPARTQPAPQRFRQVGAADLRQKQAAPPRKLGPGHGGGHFGSPAEPAARRRVAADRNLRNEAGDDGLALVAGLFRRRRFRARRLGIAEPAFERDGTRGDATLKTPRRQHGLDPRGRRETMRLQIRRRSGRLRRVAREFAQGDAEKREQRQKGKIPDIDGEVAEHANGPMTKVSGR